VVTAVDADGAAAAGELEVGDLVLRIDGEPARDPGQLDARLEAVGRGGVTLTGRRRGEAQSWRVRGR